MKECYRFTESEKKNEMYKPYNSNRNQWQDTAQKETTVTPDSK